MPEMTDAEVFGSAAAKQMSEAEVFKPPQKGFWETVKGDITRTRRELTSLATAPKRLVEAEMTPGLTSRERTEATMGPAMEAASVFSPTSRAAPIFKTAKVRAPTPEELRQQANAAYKGARFVDLQVPKESVQGLSADILQDLTKPPIPETPYYDFMAPRTHKIAELLANPEGAVAPISHLESLRSALTAIKANPTFGEQIPAQRAIDAIDQYINGLSEKDVISGDPKLTAQLLKHARGNWAAMKKDERIAQGEYAAELTSGSSGSGANFPNAIRQRIKAILLNPKARARYNKDDIAMMEDISKGGTMENWARLFSKLGPKHPITGWGPALAGFFGGDLGLSAGTLGVGHLAQTAAEKIPERKITKLREAVRRQSPYGRSGQTTTTPQYTLPDKVIAASIRGLLEQLGEQKR